MVKQSLLILIQHNCVIFREDEKQVPTKEKVEEKKEAEPVNDNNNAAPKKDKTKTDKFSIYSAVLPSILQRLRFPKFILQAKDKYGNEVWNRLVIVTG